MITYLELPKDFVFLRGIKIQGPYGVGCSEHYHHLVESNGILRGVFDLDPETVTFPHSLQLAQLSHVVDKC